MHIQDVGCGFVVEYLPRMCEVLRSIPGTTPKKKKKDADSKIMSWKFGRKTKWTGIVWN